MDFFKITPHPELAAFIECYWMMYSDDLTPAVEKIIPDGFTEIIFNYRDVYQSKFKGDWELQTPNLLTGQLTTFFYLQNTGATGSIAIKLQPAALTQLFGLSMDRYLDNICELESISHPALIHLKEKVMEIVARGENTKTQSVQQALDDFFLQLVRSAPSNPIKKSLDLIFAVNGMASVAEIAAIGALGERQLERLFKQYVGLSPKYYSRIIRFNYIFQLIKSKKSSWTEIVYQSGYYDQSHFIRDFKAFTGEDPSAYFFEEKNMANFFLNK